VIPAIVAPVQRTTVALARDAVSGEGGPLPSHRPYVTGAEPELVRQALAAGGDGSRSAETEALLEELLGGATRVLLTPSCTAALEMAAMLVGTGAGAEVIVPSFTFVSSANAFARQGARPVFVDIDPETLTLDPATVEAAVTPATAAVVPVHYAGGACRMDALADTARRHGLVIVEDAAHCIGASLHGRALGTLGALGTLSFHHTKNLSSGEGGALLVNEPRWIERAEVLRAMGTNRSRFLRGEVDRYTWVDTGSSFVMSDVTAALLRSQLEHLTTITEARLTLWNAYHAAFEGLERAGVLRRPRFVDGAAHNGHIYYVLLEEASRRDEVIRLLRRDQIGASSHYEPLHASPAGRRLGRVHGEMTHTERLAARLLRVPLWVGMTEDDVARVADRLERALRVAA
jgi:dTDP-4-amino-4,6-dideoxygalactose transaminase